MKKRIILIIYVLLCSFSCNNDNDKYEITQDYIFGNNEIQRFNIAVLKSSELNSQGYPFNSEDSLRYFCINKSGNYSNKVYFNKPTKGYEWYGGAGGIDDSFVVNDSLKNLTYEEKIKIVNEENKGTEPPIYNTMPFRFEKTKIYHLYGLSDVEGSYYLYYKNNQFIVKYFDGGP